MSSRFAGKSALVTGGGSGMGETFCKRLAAEGAAIGVLDVDIEGGTRVAADIRATGGDAVFVHADVTDAASMERAVAEVCSANGGLDIAVNNAGIGGGRHKITDFPLEAWAATMAVNVTGVFHSLRAEIPAMIATGRSKSAIVNLSSITGVIAHPLTSAYVASKHAVIGLTKSAALEWGGEGIRINAVAPTWVRTPMTEAVFDTARWQELDARHASGRVATMDDIAAVVLFLCSDEAAIVTGSVYMADGGYSAA
ncbi:SDR family oxidoreductase [Novosphingobium sp.]|uniref:SDR family NAD(P)-dependent oxidoreductase n=1 Tax=Novosphingobium sp. TaxID=1874826 RepID=UPI002637DAF5|nr:SDR family oxidoreductase [Novosphingobium sp.]